MIQSQQLPVLDLPTTADEGAGFGVLETERGCLPLTAMDVRTQVTGLWCRTRLEQTFRNASAEPIEATYVFPLPDRAAVPRCVLLVGDRRVEGVLKERAAARAAYDGAIAAGHRAAIAEEDRSGVFSLRAGNIPAGETVRVEFEMVGPLEIDEGEATWRFPLVVAPRYVAGRPLDGGPVGRGWGIDTHQVPDASRVTPPVLLPGFPNPVALSLEITLDPAGLEPSAGAWRDGMACSLHGVVSEEGPPWTVRLQPGERLDRDFLLRFPVLGSEIVGGAQLAWADDAGPGTLAVTLAPDLPDTSEQTLPRDVVVLLDRSGSMEGWKMVAARRAAGRLVDSLGDADRFAVIAFDSVVEVEQEGLQAATDRNRFQAIRWLGQLEARGGTEMHEPLVQAAGWLAGGRSGQEQSEPIIVLVTDGQVAGEDVLLQTLHGVAGDRMPRVFAVGIDQAVNAGFLRRLTDLGQGACELVESEDRLDEVMDRIAERINPPRLKNLTLEVDGVAWDRQSLVPSRLPDLFAGRPLTILGRHSGTDGPVRVRVEGQRGDGSSWKAELVATPGDADVLRSAWGRHRVRELEDRFVVEQLAGDPEPLQAEIIKVSLESGVLSRFTAFVAIDETETIDADAAPVPIMQPVERVAGWTHSMPAMCCDMEMSYCDFEERDSFVERFSRAPSSLLQNLQNVSRDGIGFTVSGLLEELESHAAAKDPAKWLRGWLKGLKGLMKSLRQLHHPLVGRIESFYEQTRVFQKWLRHRKAATGPFVSMEEWADRAREQLGQLDSSDEDDEEHDLETDDRFWAQQLV